MFTRKMLEKIDCVDKKYLLHDLQLEFLSVTHTRAQEHKSGTGKHTQHQKLWSINEIRLVSYLAFILFDFVSDHKWFQFSASMNIYNYVRTLLRLLVLVSSFQHFIFLFLFLSLRVCVWDLIWRCIVCFVVSFV